jgi:(1->4)-alpha-D-glucan 1-alpha-D-glucosylmutase
MWNALARVAVQMTSPGTPDVYQGDEMWLHALVDPDNRRPVDYAARGRALDGMPSDPCPEDAARLLASAEDGAIKLWAVSRLLAARRTEPELFARGAYLPLAVEGRGARHVIAFARQHEGRTSVTVAARLTALLRPGGEMPAGAEAWGDTTILLPHRRPGALTDVLTGTRIVARDAVPAAELLAVLPVAVAVG